MTLVAAAVCPHPPLLIPAEGVAEGPPEPLRPVLAACERAVRGLAAAAPDLVVVVGGGAATREYRAETAGSLHAFGVPVTVGAGEPLLPLSLTVGRWLLGRGGLDQAVPSPWSAAAGEPAAVGAASAGARAGARLAGEPDRGRAPAARVVMQAVDQHAAPPECRKLGQALAARAPRVAMLAMGEASARREAGARGPRALEYDDEVAEALAAADARWLGALDAGLDAKLAVAGRPAWQVLAGAAAGQRFHGRLLCMAAPYEVTYLVASWDEPQAG